MKYIIVVTYFIWLVSEILINRLLRSGEDDKRNADGKTLRMIWLTIAVSIPLAVYLSTKEILPISNHQWPVYLGLVLIFIGILLRLTVIRSLGRYFTADVTIRQTHKLKTDGFYSYVRHPTYLFSLVSFIGFGISLNDWLSLALISFVMIFAFLNRIKVEEKTLIEHFGNEYMDYKNRTCRLIPFIY